MLDCILMNICLLIYFSYPLQLGVLRALRILETEDKKNTDNSQVSGNDNLKHEDDDDMEAVERSMDAEEGEDSGNYLRQYATMFGTRAQAKEAQTEAECRAKEKGVFFRDDIPFNPDSKVRFWYNAVNVLGAYCGITFFVCLVDEKDVEFDPAIKWLAAFYATSFSFATIVYTRTIVRSILPKNIFKWVRIFVFWFLGFFTYGLFPMSYLAIMKASST